jgi:hypothetical protein
MVLNSTQTSPMLAIPDLPRLRTDGVNTVSIYITWAIANIYADDLHQTRATVSDGNLQRLTKLAHAQGLAVEWMPLVQPLGGPGGGVRFNIYPNNMRTWWARYTAMIKHYASLGAKNHVEILSVGSELGALQGFSSQWLNIVHQVKHRYHGLTTYMSAVGSGFSSLNGWWSAVDLLGVSPYWTLSTKRVPSVGEMVGAWQRAYLPQLKAISQQFGRPVLMDEIGYPNATRAAYQPSYYWTFRHRAPNQVGQANAYEALLKVLAMRQYASWLKGAVWFDWGGVKPTLPNKIGYSPRGKQAECEIAHYWAPIDPPQSSRVRNGNVCWALHG